MKSSIVREAMLAAVAALLTVGACKGDVTVPEQNAISVNTALSGGLTRPTLQLLETGLVNRDRINLDQLYLAFTQTMQRDVYRLDDAEPRFITEILGPSPDPSGFVGGGVFDQFYNAVRTANIILDSLPTAKDPAAPYTAAELSAIRGFTRTFKALELYRALEGRDSLGVPIDVDVPVDVVPGPIRCKANVLAYLTALLDSAAIDLAAAGSTPFPFALPAGFSSNGAFNTPAGFLAFNRGLAGKLEFYRALDHQRPDPSALGRALTDLNASFLSTSPADFGIGVYHIFSTAPNETANPLADAALHLNPAVGDSIQPGDLRASKITACVSGCAKLGVSTPFDAVVTQPNATNLSRPFPILRDVELVLLRAQVEIEMGNFAAATSDINAVRVGDGGLPPIPLLADRESARSAVLYEKRYSLLLEGPQRLSDLRAYGRLNGTFLKKERPTDSFVSALPIPKQEADARGGNVTPVCS
jgi:hypothetical protein